jgi:hypothetical protein
MEVDGETATISFDSVGQGLVAQGGEPLKGFAMAGPDGKFVWAEAKIDGNQVRLRAPGVSQPVAVRYAWANNPVCNLYNQEGLPAVPFRTDEKAAVMPGGFTALFDGKTLEGWRQINGTATYKVVDGAIVGETAEGSPNSFLCTEKHYEDFELQFEVKLHDDALNSGCQIRSNSDPNYQDGRVHGYQVEISTDQMAGFIYDEARRGWLSQDRIDPVKNAAFKPGQWNHYRIVCIGDQLKDLGESRAGGSCHRFHDPERIHRPPGALGVRRSQVESGLEKPLDARDPVPKRSVVKYLDQCPSNPSRTFLMANSRKRKRTRKDASKRPESRASARSGARTPARRPSPLDPPKASSAADPNASPLADSQDTATVTKDEQAPPVIRPMTPEAWHRGLALALQIEEEQRSLVMPDEEEHEDQ